MDNCERRHTRRYMVRIPLNFQEYGKPSAPKRFGEIVNISPYGVCFSTSVAPAVGQMLGIFLKLPKDVIGEPSPEWFWTGRVIYGRPCNDPSSYSEVGVQFLSCELAKSAERRRNRGAAPHVLERAI